MLVLSLRVNVAGSLIDAVLIFVDMLQTPIMHVLKIVLKILNPDHVLLSEILQQEEYWLLASRLQGSGQCSELATGSQVPRYFKYSVLNLSSNQ